MKCNPLQRGPVAEKGNLLCAKTEQWELISIS